VIQKALGAIDKSDIESLVSESVPEGRTLEYKETLPGGKDSDKKEFLADVSSFSNASGGDMLYGIEEQRDSDGKPTGMPACVSGVAIPNADPEIRRLENMIRDGIKPRIPGVHLRTIDGFLNGPVLLLRVQKSYAAPHMVTFQDHTRFYSRNSKGKYPLDVGEIRSAFALSDALPQRIRQFRNERLAQIIADETPVLLRPNPKIVLHILPLQSLNVSTSIDLTELDRKLRGPNPAHWRHLSRRYNIDGLVIYARRTNGPCESYAQFFRNGAVEEVEATKLGTEPGDKLIRHVQIEEGLIASTGNYIALEKDMGVSPPVSVMISLLGVKGYAMIPPRGFLQEFKEPIDRDTLLLPDLLLEDSVDVASSLRPALDALWQAADWPSCQNYSSEGKWQGGHA
jgi:hypothetical protein